MGLRSPGEEVREDAILSNANLNQEFHSMLPAYFRKFLEFPYEKSSQVLLSCRLLLSLRAMTFMKDDTWTH